MKNQYLLRMIKKIRFLFRNRQLLGKDRAPIQEQKTLNAAKLSALGEMAAGIAHEINNPLAIIHAKTSLALNRLKN